MSGSDKPGMIVGHKGVKYGLQIPGRKPNPGVRPGAKAGPVRQAPSVFGDDSDDEETVGAQVARQAAKKRSEKKVAEEYARALAEDPQAFDYDGVYDQLHEAREAPRARDAAQRVPKYIAALKEKAVERKREQDIMWERRQVKDRKKEDHLFADKEAFVTGAYRRKLEEDKLWQAQEQQREARDAASAPEKLGHMQNFYSNLLTKNVAYGGVAQPAQQEHQQQEADEAEQGRGLQQQHAADADGSRSVEGAVHAAAGTATKDEGGSDADGSSDDEVDDDAAEAAFETALRASGVAVDEYDRMRLRADFFQKRTERRRQQQGATVVPMLPSTNKPDDASTPAAPSSSRADPSAAHAGRPDKAKAQGAAAEHEEAPQSVPAAQVACGKRRNDDESVSSARERYLARKRQATGAG